MIMSTINANWRNLSYRRLFFSNGTNYGKLFEYFPWFMDDKCYKSMALITMTNLKAIKRANLWTPLLWSGWDLMPSSRQIDSTLGALIEYFTKNYWVTKLAIIYKKTIVIFEINVLFHSYLHVRPFALHFGVTSFVCSLI